MAEVMEKPLPVEIQAEAQSQPLDVLPPPVSAYPMCCVTEEKHKLGKVFVIEQPPGLRSIAYRVNKNVDEYESGYEVFQISWPRTLWFIDVLNNFSTSNCWLVATKEPYFNKGRFTPVFEFSMPNCYYGGVGNMCLGKAFEGIKGVMLTDHKQAADAIMIELVNTIWNEANTLGRTYTKLGLVKSMQDWAEQSKADPDLWTKFKYPEHEQKTVGKLLDRVIQRSLGGGGWGW